MPLVDLLGRPLRSLRLSVTDRCNLRCEYCMPEEEYTWLPREDLLSFEEIASVVAAFTGLGVSKIRLTGGEPLLRRDLPRLVSMLAANPAIEDIALTTNGVLLVEQAAPLHDAGLKRITVSLDTLRPDRFTELTRLDCHAKVIAAVETAARVFGGLKIDTVVIRGVNDDEMVSLLDFGRSVGAEIRFIEYMDVAGASRWTSERVFSRVEMMERLSSHYGRVEAVDETVWAPADRFRLPDGTVFGIIASTTSPFCETCDRARLTADGMLFFCLYSLQGLDLRVPLRSGATRQDLAARVEAGWRARADRGAELRLAERQRAAFPASLSERDPHLQMHTRGG